MLSANRHKDRYNEDKKGGMIINIRQSKKSSQVILLRINRDTL